MAGTRLIPEKITSPFQLMAAWFSMLVLLVSVLLTGAANISKPDWAAGYLVIFASLVVLIVLTCVTLMLTKFRPHLQEGKEYARWLKDKSSYSPGFVVKSVPPSNKVRGAPRKVDAGLAPRAKFLVGVVDAVGAVDIVEALKNASFNAEIYSPLNSQTLDSIKDNEAIWVGERLDPKATIQAIKIALSQWPDLKYIDLSGDHGGEPPDYIHDQLFVGGSSNTARENKLGSWSLEELLNMPEDISMAKFHDMIRSKYQ